jgi:MoaA/NifB/PqqE/SkfB family radical SAM enzyme
MLINSKILNLGISTVLSSASNYLFTKTGLDYTFPAHIYAELNDQCNSKCKMCSNWQETNVELPAIIWNKTFKELKSLSKNLIINFSGGEVLLKKDIFEILEFCNKENILWGITTNGILLNKANIERLIDLKPFVINISLDTLSNKTYQEIRGVPCLEIVKANIIYLMNYKEKVGSETVINLKSIVSKENIGCLEEIAKFSMKMNFAGVTYQPIIETTEECRAMMNIDQTQLLDMIDKLIVMKKDGFNIMNSASNMRRWDNYFNKNIEVQKRNCLVPLRSLKISTDGNIQLCDYIYQNIGNIEKDDIRDVLQNKRTKTLKKDLINCKKNCVYCVQRTLKDYAFLAYKFMS